jgi:hypothetical protein
LTYRGEGCHDPYELRDHVAQFWRDLRDARGVGPFPYLWTVEWHKTGHGQHVHFAVGDFIQRGLIEEAWGRGFVHIKLLGDLPVGSGTLAQARRTAGYLSKYIGKNYAGERIPGLHRYEVAQGFQPATVQARGRNRAAAIEAACEFMGGRFDHLWLSEEAEDWSGPPVVWLSWQG